MKTLTNKDKFILSSSCKVVKGARRTLLNDYLRNEVRFIPNNYYDLIQILDRSNILEIREAIDDKSRDAFDDFVSFMVSNEYAYIHQDTDLFPTISKKINDEHVILKDCIIEIDSTFYDNESFNLIINEIDSLNCDDIQIRFLGNINASFIREVLNIAQRSSINCIEIHCENNNISDEIWFEIIEEFATLSNIFIYSSNKNSKNEHIIKRSGHAPLLMGVVHHLTSSLSKDNCGVISTNNLSFIDIRMYHLTQKFNGCLYKKLTIDKEGNIKNCLYMNQSFGKVSKGALKKVINDSNFRSLWFICKDEISICKDCEFRYNCTDCRAFLSDKMDPNSKPRKCGYNPYTNEWEINSKNPLKMYETL